MGLSNQIGASSLIRPGVIDNTAARPASPYEGQVIFQKDTDQLLVWNGTAWVIPNSPAQNPQGLELVKTQTIGTAVSTVTVSGAFSATYDNYKIIVTGGNSSAACSLRFELDGVTSGYYSAAYGATYGAGAFTSGNASNQATFPFVGYANGSIIMVMNMDVFSPFLARETFYTAAPMANSAFTGYMSSSGECVDTVSRTGFILSTSTGTLTGGTINVYGYRKS